MSYSMRRFLMSLFALATLTSASLRAQSTPPVLNEGFAKGLPSGWTIQNLKGDQKWKADASAGSISFVNSGNKTNGSVSLLVTDDFLIKDYDEPVLIYRYKSDKRAGDTDSLMIMYRTSADGEWIYLEGRSAEYAPDYVSDTIFLSNKESEFYQIAFMAVDRLGGGIAIDSVIVRECPDCLIPVVSCYNVGMTTTSLMWTECGDALSYRLCVNTEPCAGLLKDPEFKADFLDIEVNEAMYDLTDLKMGQEYYVYVRTNCANETSGFSIEQTFTTLNTETIPYFENFNSPYTGFSSTLYSWYYNEGDITPFINTQCTETNLANFSADKTTALVFAKELTYGVEAYPANTVVYTATPELVGAELSECQVSFIASWVNKSSYTTPLIVGTMSNPKDIETFTAVDTVYVTRDDGFKEVYVSLKKAKTGDKHLAFMYDFSYQAGIVIDNMLIEKVPACDKARDIEVSIKAVDDVTVSWHGTNGGEIWFAQEKLDFSKPDFGATKEIKKYTAGSNPYKITDLTQWTKYYIYVKNSCTDAPWSEPYIVRTPEKAENGSRYFDFNLTDVYEDGVNKKFPVGMTAKYNHDAQIYFSDRQSPMYGRDIIFVKLSNASQYTYLISPEFETLSDKRVSFFTHTYSNGKNRIVLGVMSDANDIETFYPIDTLHVIYELKYQVIDLGGYDVDGKGRFFALKFIAEEGGNGQVNCLVDNMTIKPIPTCLDPKDVEITPDVNSAAVKWNANGASRWEVRISEQDNYENLFDASVTDWVYNRTVETPEFTVEGLKARATKYFVYFRSMCDGESGDWTKGFSFKTLCTPISESVYNETFDMKASMGTGTFSEVPCYSLHGNATLNISNFAGGKLCLTSSGNDKEDVIVAMPEYIGNLGDIVLKVMVGNRGNDGEFIELGVMTDPEDPATFEKVSQISVNYSSSYGDLAFVSDESYFTTYTGSGKYIAFRVPKDKTAKYEIDEISLATKDPCPKMKSLQVSEITGTTAKVDWIGNTETKWDVVLSRSALSAEKLDEAAASGKTDDVVVIAERTTQKPYPAKDLKHNTFYYFYVRAVCGDVHSEWCEYPASFRTDCGVLPVDKMQSETFEGYNNGTVPNCWVCSNTGESYVGSSAHKLPEISNQYYHSGAYSLHIYAIKEMHPKFDNTMYAVSPEIDTKDISKLQVSFWGYALKEALGEFQGQLTVGILSDTSDLGTFVPVEVISNFQSEHYYTIPFDKYKSDMYGNKGKMVMFSTLFSKENDFFIDDIEFSEISGCEAPAHIMVDNVTCDGASLSWADGKAPYIVALAEGAPLRYADLDTLDKVANVVVKDVNVAKIDFTELKKRTDYYVYIGSVCNGDTLWGNVQGFQTACEAEYPLPYEVTFDEKPYTGHYAFQDCWTGFYSEERVWYQRGTITDGGYEGNGIQLDAGSASYTTYHVMPKLAGKNNETLISFYAKKPADRIEANVVVGVVTDMTSRETIARSFTPVETVSLTKDGYNKYYVPMKSYKGKEGNIAFTTLFRQTLDGTGKPAGGIVMLDNVVAETLPSCIFPVYVSVDTVASNFISMSFEELGDANAWQVACVPTGEKIDENNLLDIDTKAFRVKDLTPVTTYDIYIRSVCGENSSSPWVGPYTQRTATDAVSNYPASEDFEGNVTVWQMLSAENTNAWVIGDKGIADTKSLYISNNGADAKYNPAVESKSVIYRSLYLNSGIYDFAYDMADLGSNVTDNVMFGVMPTTGMFKAGSDEVVYADGSVSTIAAELIRLEGADYSDNKVSGYITITDDMAGYYNLVFYWSNRAASGEEAQSVAIDNISIDRSSCVQPLNVYVGRTTSREADVKWEMVGEAAEYAEWQVVVTANAATLPDQIVAGTDKVDMQTVTKPETVVKNLEELTTYYTYVRAKCAKDGTYTNWSKQVSFTTPCNPIKVGHVYTFEDSSSNGLADCIDKVDIIDPFGKTIKNGFSVATDASTIYAKNGKKAMRLNGTRPQNLGTYIVLPEIEGSLDNVQLTFWMRPFGHKKDGGACLLNSISGGKLDYSASTVQILAAEDLNDTATFTYIDQAVYPYTDDEIVNNYTLITDDVNGFDYWVKVRVPLKGFDGQRIIIKDNNAAKKTNYLYIDDLAIEEIPACQMPLNVMVDKVTDTAVEVSFTGDAFGSYEYRVSTDPKFTGVTPIGFNGTHFKAENLMPNTVYYIGVRRNCGSEQSEWTLNNRVVTSYSVRYEEKFSETRVLPLDWKRTSSSSSDIETVFQLPDEVKFNYAVDSETKGWVYSKITEQTSAHQVITLVNGKSNFYWLFTPTVYIPEGEEAYLSFDAALTVAGTMDEVPESNRNGNNLLYVIVSGDGGRTWENKGYWDFFYGTDEIPNFYEFGNSFRNIRIDLSKYAGKNVKVAYYITDGGAVDVDFHLDNVYINAYKVHSVTDVVCEARDYVHAESGIRIASEDLVKGVENKFDIYQISEDGASDALYSFSLSVNDYAVTTLYKEICQGSSYSDENFTNLTEPGIYKFKTSATNTCDSIVVLNLTIKPMPKGELLATICRGEKFNWNGEDFTEQGDYERVVESTVEGICDSLITLRLTVNSSVEVEKVHYLCDGETLQIAGQNFVSDGSFAEHSVTEEIEIEGSCDSIVTHNIIYAAKYNRVIEAAICSGETYDKNGFSVQAENSYVNNNVSSLSKCDSIVTLNLIVIENGETSRSVERKITTEQLPYEFYGNTYDKNTQAGTYTGKAIVTSESGACSMTVDYKLIVETGVGVDNVYASKPLVLTPNPINAGESVIVNAEFTAAELAGMVVEVYGSTGTLLQRFVPDSDPIAISGFNTSGIYVVRITDGRGAVYIEKVIVK